MNQIILPQARCRAATARRDITPPVGINLYVVQGIRTDGGSFTDVIVGAIPFVATLIVFTILMIYFPQIALWLPNHVYVK